MNSYGCCFVISLSPLSRFPLKNDSRDVDFSLAYRILRVGGASIGRAQHKPTGRVKNRATPSAVRDIRPATGAAAASRAGAGTATACLPAASTRVRRTSPGTLSTAAARQTSQGVR